HAKMAESSDAEHGDQVAGTRPAVSQRIEGGNSCAEERRGVFRFQIVGNGGERLVRCHHVLGVAAVIGNPRYLSANARDEVAATARAAVPAMAAMPAHTHAHAFLP